MQFMGFYKRREQEHSGHPAFELMGGEACFIFFDDGAWRMGRIMNIEEDASAAWAPDNTDAVYPYDASWSEWDGRAWLKGQLVVVS